MRNHKLLATAAVVAAATLAFATPSAAAASGTSAADPTRESSTIQVFQQLYNNPGGIYLGGASCLVPLAMPDNTIVGSTTACGITSIFAVAPPGMEKLSVPATLAASGGARPDRDPEPRCPLDVTARPR